VTEHMAAQSIHPACASLPFALLVCSGRALASVHSAKGQRRAHSTSRFRMPTDRGGGKGRRTYANKGIYTKTSIDPLDANDRFFANVFALPIMGLTNAAAVL
jgi:hypothetical protein